MAIRPKALRRSLACWNQCCGAIPTTWARIITTFMPSKHRLHPEWALASAKRLETLAPAAGHLVHMPAHTYFRIGDYPASARSNVVAAETDRVYLRDSGTTGSMYDLMYYAHNLHFLAASNSMAGNFADAKRAAQ